MMSAHSGSGSNKPQRSRYCGSSSTGQSGEHLFDALRELEFEQSLDIDGQRLRVGLANNAWQVHQARLLLEKLQSRNGHRSGARPLCPGVNHAVAVALKVAPASRSLRAQGILVLRRDSSEGLGLESRHPERLAQLREQGARLIEIELVAFEEVSQLENLLHAMIKSLLQSVHDWQATDILVECPREHARIYCRLGFRRSGPASEDPARLLLRLPAARLLKRLPRQY